MKPLISVVLPIYGVEGYLDRCVESVLEQTYDNIEVILVDDGSKDNCPQKCDEWAKRDSRIVVLHKENGGLSDARNKGTEMAKGEYITYIDSDDFVDKTYVEYLYGLIEKNKTPMSLCTHTVVFPDGKENVIGDGTQEVLEAEDCLRRMLYDDVVNTSAWAKLYQIDLAKKYLYPKGKLYEDIGTVYQYFIESKKIACGYESHYFYMLRENSIVTGAFNSRKLELLEMTDKMAKDVKEVFPELEEAIIRRQVYARFSTLNQLADVKGKKEIKKMLIRYIAQYRWRLLKNSLVPKRDKFAIVALMFGYPVYKLGWKMKG